MRAAQTSSAYVVTVPSFSFSVKCNLRLLISLIAFGLVIAGFVMQLVRIFNKNDDCNNGFESAEACREYFRMYWWTSSFELLIALVSLLFLATGLAKTMRIFLSVCLGISTVLCMFATDYFLNPVNHRYNRYGFYHSEYKYHRSYSDDDEADTIGVTGYILSSIANFLLIYLVGGEPKQTSALDNETNVEETLAQPILPVQTFSQATSEHQKTYYPPAQESSSVQTHLIAPSSEDTLPQFVQGLPAIPPGPK